jgi:hypothetical protein
VYGCDVDDGLEAPTNSGMPTVLVSVEAIAEHMVASQPSWRL